MLNLFWNYWIEAAEEDLLETWTPAEYYQFDEVWNDSILCEGRRELEQSNAAGIKQHLCVSSLSLIYELFKEDLYQFDCNST